MQEFGSQSKGMSLASLSSSALFNDAALFPGLSRVNRSLIKAAADLLKTRLPGVGMQKSERDGKRDEEPDSCFLIRIEDPDVTFWEKVEQVKPLWTPLPPSLTRRFSALVTFLASCSKAQVEVWDKECGPM